MDRHHAFKDGIEILRASSGSRSTSNSIEPLRSAKRTVTCPLAQGVFEVRSSRRMLGRVGLRRASAIVLALPSPPVFRTLRDLEPAGSSAPQEAQAAWLETKLHHAAPQTLTVPSDSTKELVTSIPSRAQVGAVADRAPRVLLRRLVPIAPSAGALAVVFVVVALGTAIGRHAGLLGSAASPRRFGPRTDVPQSLILRKSGWSPIVGLLRSALK
jgi:hypothetical protein